MKPQIGKTLILLLAFISLTGLTPQAQRKTYARTRRLLLKVEQSPANKALKALFEHADERREDLIRAMYDPEHKVSLNAQLILKYLAGQQDIEAIEEWYAYRRDHQQEYWMAPVEVLTEVQFLKGKGSDLAKLVLKNLHPESEGITARVVAINRRRKAALIEVVHGNVFTEGWHVVIRQENGRWRLISNNLVWQS
jgi:hypothetical protein